MAWLLRMKPPRIGTKQELFYELTQINTENSPPEGSVVLFINDNISVHLENISKDLKYLKNFAHRTEESDQLLIRWNFAANVLDRLFLIISIFYVIITLLAIILVDPNVYHFSN